MPNITLRIENENLVRSAKVLAAKRGVSLSRVLADYLEEWVRRDSEYERAKADALELLRSGLSLGGSPLTRDEAHARHDVNNER
jgi:hypothetical protein